MPDTELIGTLNRVGLGDVLLFVLSLLCILALMRNKLAKIFPNSKLFAKISNYNNGGNKNDNMEAEKLNQLISAINELNKSTVNLTEKIQQMETKTESMEKNIQMMKDDYSNLKEHMSDLETTDQTTSEKCDFLINADKENKRSYFVDKFNEFVLKKKEIDIYSLSVLEKHYERYLRENGNSFVASIMSRIRALNITYNEVDHAEDKDDDFV